MQNIIHPTAIVHEGAVLGTGNYIGAYAIIHDKVTIGNNNYIGSHCIIGEIGESIKFFDKEPLGVFIGDNNRFTKQVTVDQGTEITTRIFDNCLVLKNGHIGHDVIMNNGSQVRCNVVIGGHCILDEDSLICLNSVVQPRITVPLNAMIGACSNVTKKSILVKDYVHYGNPCKPIRPRD